MNLRHDCRDAICPSSAETSRSFVRFGTSLIIATSAKGPVQRSETDLPPWLLNRQSSGCNQQPI
ncbi:hypothetical protein T09_4810 [Trichinella sp. T9]|nr:hypothetical protein T09_4810 [Trichinella sp. T9]